MKDHLGSTRALTDSTGAVISSANYDAFGNSTNNLNTRYQYTGREFDADTGLYYYRARWYDAQIGRFISEDPIGFAGGDVNLYGYVRNNSANLRDPSGKVPPLVIGAIIVGGLILTSPEYVNAPGPGDPVYRPENPVILNAAAGGILGYLGSRFLGPVISRYCGSGGKEVTDDFITLYRGDNPGTSVIKSPAAKEGGYEFSKNLLNNGNIDDLMRNHALDSSNPASPFISASSNPDVARFFAGPNGVVNELRVPAGRALYNHHNNMFIDYGGRLIPESEYLIPHYIRPSEFVR